MMSLFCQNVNGLFDNILVSMVRFIILVYFLFNFTNFLNSPKTYDEFQSILFDLLIKYLILISCFYNFLKYCIIVSDIGIVLYFKDLFFMITGKNRLCTDTGKLGISNVNNFFIDYNENFSNSDLNISFENYIDNGIKINKGVLYKTDINKLHYVNINNPEFEKEVNKLRSDFVNNKATITNVHNYQKTLNFKVLFLNKKYFDKLITIFSLIAINTITFILAPYQMDFVIQSYLFGHNVFRDEACKNTRYDLTKNGIKMCDLYEDKKIQYISHILIYLIPLLIMILLNIIMYFKYKNTSMKNIYIGCVKFF
jgi:hypothetical protein